MTGKLRAAPLRGERLFARAAEGRLDLTLPGTLKCWTCPNVVLCNWKDNLWLPSTACYAGSCSSCFTLHCSGSEDAPEAREVMALCSLLKLLPACPGAGAGCYLQVRFVVKVKCQSALSFSPLEQCVATGQQFMEPRSARAFLRNPLTLKDVSGTFPEAAVLSELLFFLSSPVAFPGVGFEMPHLGKGKLLVMCVTCMLGRMWPRSCWFGTTELVVGNHSNHLPLHLNTFFI